MDKGRNLWLAAALFLLSACGPPPYAVDEARQELEARDRVIMAPYIGRPLWTIGIASYFVCRTKDMLLGGGCFTGRGQFTFDSFEGLDPESSTEEVLMHVTFADGRSGFTHLYPISLKMFIRDHDPMKAPGTYPSFLDGPKAGKSLVARRKLQGALLQMTEAQVLAGAWGKPDRVVERDSFSRGRVEWWFYPENNVLVFEDGLLADIQVSRK